MKTRVSILLFVLLGLVISTPVRAGKEKMNARLNASGFVVGGTSATADNKFPNVTLSGNAVVVNSTARVTLGLDNYITTLNYLGNTNTYLKVGIKVSVTNAAGVSSSYVKELEINYNATGLSSERANFVVKNAHSVIARILYFKNAANVIVTNPLIPSNIYLESEIETERYYNLNPTTLATVNHFYQSTTNELEVYWNSIPGAEEYELEYTYVNNYNPTSVAYNYEANTNAVVNFLSQSSLRFTFNNNATRIRTTQNNFKISLNYNDGFIVYRVRAIGRRLTNPDLEVIGNWTLNQPQNILDIAFSSLPGTFNDVYAVTAHEANKNWQITSTFAEDGKKKEVISYFDGSNKKRQTVTRNNSDNISLVGETMYDSQGRPAITVLPSPSSNYSSEIKFFENFNQSVTQPLVGGVHVPYSRLDFENPSSATCPVPADVMYSGVGGNGASQYYSTHNSNKENQNAYIPDANNYPFTQTTYAPDGTGTVRYQSGVGSEHRIGNGHETKTIEGDPEQEDLDKLFGSEAGYAEKYKKNMTVDPNGQISVSYVNSENKTIATALAGNAPTNLTQLSNLNVYPKNSKYLDYNAGNYVVTNVAANGALTFKKKLLPDITGTYNFMYDLTVPQYTETCITNFCYDCGYNLEITLTDECGAVIYSKNANVGAIAGSVDYTCGAPIYFSSAGFTPAFTAVLTAGKEYFLTKVLTIDKNVMNDYMNHYISTANNTCVKDLNYFQNLELANIDYSDCNMSCSTCVVKLNAYYALHNNINATIPGNSAYDPNYIYMSPAQYNQAKDQCNKPCEPLSLCQTEFENMLQDVRPMGQYAKYNVVGNYYTAAGNDLSIMDSLNFMRITTIMGAPANVIAAGTPFKTYDVTKVAFWRNPEYYNASAHNFSSPDPLYNKDHYFDANGNLSKVRVIKLPSGAFYPAVINTATFTSGTTGVLLDNLGFWTCPENLCYLKDFVFAYSNNPHWAYSMVKNHPEFNYFLDCDRLSDPVLYTPNTLTSDQFDAKLRASNSFLDANGLAGPNAGNPGFINWPTITNSSNPNDPTLDLLSADPYFKIGNPGAGLASAFSARLTNYKGGGKTIKEIAAEMYSTSQMYYSGCAGTFGATSIVCGANTYAIPSQALDDMWNAYRDLYLAEKQQFLMEQAHITASNPGGLMDNYYNGAIGDPNFTPWDSYAKYGFFPFPIPLFGSFGSGIFSSGFMAFVVYNNPSLWPNYAVNNPGYQPIPALTYFHPLNGRGYYDYGSPSSFYHASRYGSKVRRVPDVQTISNALAGGATNDNDMASNLTQAAEIEIYQQTGQCPIYKRLELFLQRTAKSGKLFLFNTVHPLVNEPSFTKEMYDAIVGCGGLTPGSWTPLGFKSTPQSGSILKIEFYDMSGSIPVHLGAGSDIVLTSTSFIANWNDVKLFKDIQFNGTNSLAQNTFNIKALYQSGAGQPYSVIKFTGTTCVASNCQALIASLGNQVCQPSSQAFKVQSFLSAVVSDYNNPAVTKPLNLGANGTNNASNFFTLPVRTPFTNAVISGAGSGSHSVTVTNFGNVSVIGVSGKDGANQNINVDFTFLPASFTGPQDLSSALFLSNININAPGYDFTMKAHYAGNVTQVFNVNISYPPGLCNIATPNACLQYNLKTCQPLVSPLCQSNSNYLTMVQYQALLNEMVTYPSGLMVSTAQLQSYTPLLQSQFGAGVSTLFNTSSSSPNPVNPALTDYFFQLDTNVPGALAGCQSTFSFTSSNALLAFNTLTFSGITAIGPPSSIYSISATDGTNTYTFMADAICLIFDNCIECKDTSLLKIDFEQTPVNPFVSKKYDPVNIGASEVNTNFIGNACFSSIPSYNTICFPPTQTINQFGDKSIRSNNSCGFTAYNNHTPNGTRYVSTLVNHFQSNTPALDPTTYLIPWKTTTPLTVVAGKKYRITYYFRPASTCEHSYIVNTEVHDGTQNFVLNSFGVTTNDNSYQTYAPQWNKVSALFVATSNALDFKIRLTPYNTADAVSNGGYRGGFSLDDIEIEEVICEKEIAPIVPTDSIEDDCVNQLTNIALSNAQQKYNLYINEVKQNFIQAYTEKCYKSLERLHANYQSSEGHYTLYYYDQGGNLIKTVPPEGVEPLNLAAIEPISGLTYEQKIANDRANKTKTVFTNHRMATRYEYNSLNQLIRQHMPDHSDVNLFSTTAINGLAPGLSALSMDFSNPTKGYMITSNGASTGLYISNNGGQNWSPASFAGSGDVRDIDYTTSGSAAVAIVSNGLILRSTNYGGATPSWQSLSLPGSNTMQFNDIKFYSASEGYICGNNGLLLKTTDGGLSWNTVTIGTAQDLTRLDFRNDGSGMYGIVVGKNGAVFYATPSNMTANLWVQFMPLSTNVDVLNVSIVETGNGSSSYMTAIVSGVDKNLTPNRGTVIELKNLDNVGSAALSNLYFNTNTSAASDMRALMTNKYTSGANTIVDVVSGGSINSITPVLVKLQSTNAVYGVATNLTLPAAALAVNDLVKSGTGNDAIGVTQEGKYIAINLTSNVVSTSNLFTSGANVNTSACARINRYNANQGLVSGQNGAILKFDNTVPTNVVSQSQTAFSLPANLTAVTAAKDGSGRVFAVGGNGTIVYSSNFGASWQLLNAGIGSANLTAALYVPAASPRVVLGGTNGYVGELDFLSTTPSVLPITSISSVMYKSIATPFGNTSAIYLAGDNSGSAAIHKFTLGAAGSLNSISVSGNALNQIAFSNTGLAYAVGNGGTILKSNNNGASFTSLTSGSSNHLNAVWIADQFNASAYGANNTILKTSDGGVNWNVQSTAGTNNINAVYALGNGQVLAAGSGATNLMNINDQTGDYSSRFFYDELGRLIISQNSKQFNKLNKAYSYTIYDALGRITQVGEIAGGSLTDPMVLSGNVNGVINMGAYTTWLGLGTKSEVTTTMYDITFPSGALGGFVQSNTRKRVSATFIDTDANFGNGFTYGTIYNYDIHGNVKGLLQYNPNMPTAHIMKRIEYTYDLISGKVNEVAYQKGQADAFYHKYEYDADNRITNVLTSKDAVDWQQDAKYFYYLHGPLARTELGEDKVQGMDYAYTIQGWIKGVNSMNVAKNNDIGKDGTSGTLYNSAIPDLHKHISDDAMGYSLHYFGYNSGSNFVNDYTAIDPTKNTATNRFDGTVNSHQHFTTTNSLFNGNIMAMATGIYPSGNTLPSATPQPQLAYYKYDQLNRLLSMMSTQNLTSNSWVAGTGNVYRNEFSYDAAGNILNQKRYNQSGVQIDDMNYQYHIDGANKKQSNRLYHVNDNTGFTALSTDDIDDQGAFTPAPTAGTGLGQINTLNNYAYDEIGNLVKDNAEGIASIDWTMHRKIKSITRTSTSTAKNVVFEYNADGHRISKTVFSTGQPLNLATTTYYVRDAQGSILATYEWKPSGVNNTGPQKLSLVEHEIYGSSRLGVRTYADIDNVTGITSPYNTNTTSYEQNLKSGAVNYALSNHISNVLSVISDRKIAVDVNNNNVVDFYKADLLSVSDYAPFGSPLMNRNYTSVNHSLGFNGMRKDDEITVNGGSYTTEFRQYDSRLGRWLSIDPKSDLFPAASPYLINNNSPLVFIDTRGDCPVVPVYVVYGLYTLIVGSAVVTTAVVVNKVKTSNHTTFQPFREAPQIVLDKPKPQVTTDPNRTSDKPKEDPKGKPNPEPTPSPILTSPDDVMEEKEPKVFFVTYTKLRENEDGTTTTYSGRTSGVYYGETPTLKEAQAAVSARDLGHKDKIGYGPAVVDKYSTVYTAIRGREQQLIDHFGKAQSEGGTSGNKIRGVGKNNPRGPMYHSSSNTQFGELHKYTGNVNSQKKN